MPLFKNKETYEVCFRKYEFNQEVSDGIIVRCQETDKALLLKISENNVTILDTNFIDIIWDNNKEKIGKEGITIITQSDLNKFINKNKLVANNFPNQKVINTTINTRMRLIRDNEKPIYTYKQPNLR